MIKFSLALTASLAVADDPVLTSLAAAGNYGDTSCWSAPDGVEYPLRATGATCSLEYS